MENPCRCASHKLYYFLDFEMSIRNRALRIEYNFITSHETRAKNKYKMSKSINNTDDAKATQMDAPKCKQY